MSSTLSQQRRAANSSWLRRSPLASLSEEFESLFSRVLGEEGGAWRSAMSVPPLDLSETDGKITVRMDLPGVKPDDVKIQLNNHQLTISGERQEVKEEKGEAYHRLERQIGRFSRSITLPCEVEEEQIEARYKEGVLTVTLPKSFEAKAKQIEIKAN